MNMIDIKYYILLKLKLKILCDDCVFKTNCTDNNYLNCADYINREMQCEINKQEPCKIEYK